MNEVRNLFLLELRSLYGINRFRYTKDKKEKNRYRLLAGAWIWVLIVVFVYVAGLVYGLCMLGLGSIVPLYLTVIASLLIAAFGLFKAGSWVFGRQGYDILAAMPVKTCAIVAGRFLAMYVEDLLLAMAIFLPGMIAYGICLQPHPGTYVAALAGCLFVPAIPLVISTLLGTLVMALSARLKHKSLVQSVLMIGVVLLVLAGSISMPAAMDAFSAEKIAALAATAGEVFGQLYPPAAWLGRGIADLQLGYLGVFVAVSVLVMAMMVWLVSSIFHPVVQRLQNVSAKHQYRIDKIESWGIGKALYVREVKRYFSSSIYVTNTVVGPILGAVMSVALCAVGVESIESQLPNGLSVYNMLPFVTAMIFCTMTTTSTAISMEGKQIWVVQSLPVPAKALLDSKLLLNLTVMLPFYVVSIVAQSMALQPDFVQLLLMMLVPGAFILFSVVFGLSVNLKFHSFDWEKEETVVKQSLSAALGGFGGVLLAGACFVGVFVIPLQFVQLFMGIVCLLLLCAAAALYNWNNRAELSRL